MSLIAVMRIYTCFVSLLVLGCVPSCSPLAFPPVRTDLSVSSSFGPLTIKLWSPVSSATDDIPGTSGKLVRSIRRKAPRTAISTILFAPDLGQSAIFDHSELPSKLVARGFKVAKIEPLSISNSQSHTHMNALHIQKAVNAVSHNINRSPREIAICTWGLSTIPVLAWLDFIQVQHSLSLADQQSAIGAVVVGSPPNIRALLRRKAMGPEVLDPYAHACDDVRFFGQWFFGHTYTHPIDERIENLWNMYRQDISSLVDDEQRKKCVAPVNDWFSINPEVSILGQEDLSFRLRSSGMRLSHLIPPCTRDEKFWTMGQMLKERILVLQSKCEDISHREYLNFPDDHCDERGMGHRTLRDNPVWCPATRSCSDLFADMFDAHPVITGDATGRSVFANTNTDSVEVITDWFDQLARSGYI